MKKSKRIIALILAIVTIFSAVSISASAEEAKRRHIPVEFWGPVVTYVGLRALTSLTMPKLIISAAATTAAATSVVGAGLGLILAKDATVIALRKVALSSITNKLIWGFSVAGILVNIAEGISNCLAHRT